MSYQVLLTEGAVGDLQSIDRYIAEHDSLENADYVLAKLESCIEQLAAMPERGVCPLELAQLGNKEFREIFFKPYRIIYRVDRKRVYVYEIADGRRDMQTLLKERLL